MLALLSIEVARGRGFWLCIYHNLDLPTYGTDVGMYVNTTYIRFYSIYVDTYDWIPTRIKSSKPDTILDTPDTKKDALLSRNLQDPLGVFFT